MPAAFTFDCRALPAEFRLSGGTSPDRTKNSAQLESLRAGFS
jgi:hypothetical protein